MLASATIARSARVPSAVAVGHRRRPVALLVGVVGTEEFKYQIGVERRRVFRRTVGGYAGGQHLDHAVRVRAVESVGDYMGMGAAAPRPGYMQLGAIVQAPGRTVFMKVVGPQATVESNRAAFEAMIAGIH